jgi:TatD DNase family protein
MTELEWIDTHCHLDAAEFEADRESQRQRARQLGVTTCVLPAVERANWPTVTAWAQRHQDVYALGIHPLFVPRMGPDDLQALHHALQVQRDDPALVAVGEIGLDRFEGHPDLDLQVQCLRAQLSLAQAFELPVILHVRRAVDLVLKELRRCPVRGGIAHAFNGSAQQAQMFIDLGFALGLGGALTYERSLRLRDLARELPLSALVLETDAPDIPPQWLYRTAEQRAQGQPQGRNSPVELPRIAAEVAQLRGISLAELALASSANARRVLRWPVKSSVHTP